MSVSFTFDQARQVIILSYQDEWTWRESHATVTESLALGQGNPTLSPYTYIVDLSTNTYLPANGLGAHIQEIADLVAAYAIHISLWVIVMPHANPMRDMLNSTLERYCPQFHQYRFVDTLELAYQLVT